MSRNKGTESVEAVSASIKVLKQLKGQAGFVTLADSVLPHIASPKIQNGMILDTTLRETFSDLPTVLTDPKETNGISAIFIQLFVLDYFYTKDQPKLDTVGEVWQYFVDSEDLKKTFVHRVDRSLMIVYLEHFAAKTWNNLALTLDNDWSSITLLDESLLYCDVSLDGVFYFLRTAKEQHPNDLGIPSLGRNVLLKLQQEVALKKQLNDRLHEVFENGPLLQMLPTFLRALIDDDTKKFQLFAEQLTSVYGQVYPGETYFAIGVACPGDAASRTLFKSLIDDALQRGELSEPLYLQAAGVLNLSSADVVGVAISISQKAEDAEGFIQPIRFLQSNLQSIDEKWFREIAFYAMTRIKARKSALLEGFIYSLKEINTDLVYRLFTARFAAFGEEGLLNDSWNSLVEEDPGMFSRYLTLWLLDGNALTHRAVLFLCSAPGIPSNYFKVSPELMQSASSSDKLYIAYKIAGYVYTAEHLQGLLFSLLESVLADEERLLDSLFQLFYNYVIYNYRGTLDKIDRILENQSLPLHLIEFYSSLRVEYNQYFAELDKVKSFRELQPDNRLGEFIQFYRQQKFSAEMNNAERKGLSSLFKNTPVHSHRWAIRRPEQAVHEVHPLGHISTSVEFPSGEKLNPTYQEMTRRTYQRLLRDEINIG